MTERGEPGGFQPRLGGDEIRGVEALREPAVHAGHQITGFGALALALPQARQAHGGTQLQRLGLLAAGHLEGLLEAGFRPPAGCGIVVL